MKDLSRTSKCQVGSERRVLDLEFLVLRSIIIMGNILSVEVFVFM